MLLVAEWRVSIVVEDAAEEEEAALHLQKTCG